MTLRQALVVSLLLAISPPIQGAASKAFFAQEESAQHLLQKEGDRFRLMRLNMISTHAGIAAFDPALKTGTEPSMHLTDADEKEQGGFTTHFPVAIQPSTEYILRFRGNLRSVRGAPPYAEVILLDFNRDPIDTRRWEANAADAGRGWKEREIRFVTPRNGHALVVVIWSGKAGTCDAAFDDAVLTQLSAPGARPPKTVPLEGISTAGLAAAKGQAVALPPGSDAMLLNLAFSWRDPQGDLSLDMEWLDGTGRRLGADACRWSRMRGIQPEWDGLQLEWRRHRGDPADKASQRLERFSDRSPGRGAATLEHEIPVPRGAASVRFIQHGAGAGGIRLDSLNAESITGPATK